MQIVHSQHPGSRGIEHIGSAHEDFQDWRPWRPLVVETARPLLDCVGGTLVIPQTVLVGDVRPS